MKKRILSVLLLCLGGFSNEMLLAQYSNTTLNGPWLIYQQPLRPAVDTTMYMVFDGNGTITDMSGFGTITTGNYHVTASGTLSALLVCQSLSGNSDSLQFTGQLTSQTTGTLHLVGMDLAYNMQKISNPGALTDSLSGILGFVCGSKNIVLRLNSDGVITAASGSLVQPVSGRVYTESGVFIGHVKTGDLPVQSCISGGLTIEYSWDEFTIIGTYQNASLVGVLEIDGPYDIPGTVNLVRTGSVSGTFPALASDQRLLVYPNPANTFIALNIVQAGHQEMELEIFNMVGEKVKSGKLNQNRQKIDIADLKDGIG